MWHNGRVMDLQKFLSHLLLVVMITTQTLSSVFAEEGAVLHTLEELPSSRSLQQEISDSVMPVIQHEEYIPEEASPDSIISLIAAKKEFDDQQMQKRETLISLPSLSSILDQGSVFWEINVTDIFASSGKLISQDGSHFSQKKESFPEKSQ